MSIIIVRKGSVNFTDFFYGVFYKFRIERFIEHPFIVCLENSFQQLTRLHLHLIKGNEAASNGIDCETGNGMDA